MVLICPSGFHGDESLPVIEGVRRSNYHSLVKSVFHSDRFATEGLVEALRERFQDRRWKMGVLRTLRGTVGHSVASLLPEISHPTLLISAPNDRVISDVTGSIRAANAMRRARQVVIPKCGHAPQIEKPRLVNHLISRFLRDKLKNIPPALDAQRSLEGETEERQEADRTP